MSRHPRVEFPGALYHVFTRGNNRQAIFIDDEDRLAYLNGLQRAHERMGLTIYAFSLMGNHVHHLVETAETPLRRVMQSLLTRYARRFNMRHGRIGHLFQGRYRALLCERDRYLLELIRYIHLNPARAGLVTDPAKWPWSSHPAYLGRMEIPWVATGPVLERFSKEPRRARELYEQFILDGIGRRPSPLLEPSRDMAIIGPGEFHARAQRALKKPKKRKSDLPQGRKRLEDILADVAKRHRISLAVFRGQGRQHLLTQARREALLEAIEMGWPQVSVARAFRRRESWVTHTLGRWGKMEAGGLK